MENVSSMTRWSLMLGKYVTLLKSERSLLKHRSSIGNSSGLSDNIR